jgi:hypothetical protein
MSHPNLTLLEACLTDEMVSAIKDLLALNKFIVSELAIRDLWDDGVFAGLQVVPLLSKLLSIRHETSRHNPAFSRQESCRISATLYLAGIWRRFGVNLATGIYISKLKDAIITQDNSNLDKSDPILLWILLIDGVQSLIHAEHKWFVSATAELIVRRQFNRWEELVDTLGGVLWIEGILDVECDEFHRELSAESWNTYGHIFS